MTGDPQVPIDADEGGQELTPSNPELLTELPRALIDRWQHAIKNDTVLQWKNVCDFAESLWWYATYTKASVEVRNDFAFIANIAHQRQIDLQPIRIDYI